jgi:hypothetical protein
MARIDITPRRYNAIKNSAKGVVPSFLKGAVTGVGVSGVAGRKALKGAGKISDRELKYINKK